MIANQARPRALPRSSFQTDALRSLYAGEVFYLPSADRLYPGHVLAPGGSNGGDGGGHFKRLMVLAAELRGSRVLVTRRPLMGGSASQITLHASNRVRVNGSGTLDLFNPELVPAVPVIEIPKCPGEGDEIWSQSAETGGAAGRLRYRFQGGSWVDPRTGWDVPGADVRRATTGVHALSREWFVYRPGGEGLQLYVDGQRFPAKPVDDLEPGDVLPAPGGASFRVTRVESHLPGQPTRTRFLVEVEAVSAYPWANRYRGAVKGAVFSEYVLKADHLPCVAA